MAVPVFQIGRLGQLYAKDEGAGSYGVPVTFASTDAYRHIDVSLSHDWKRRDSLEKRGTPGLRDRFSSPIVAGLDLKKSYLSPSGTIQTKPEANVFLRNGWGVERVGTLTTTVASGPSTTGATLTSVTGLAVGDFVLITSSGSPAGTYPRIITSITGSVVAWDPPLAGAPNASDPVVQGVTYSLANAQPSSIALAWFLPNLNFGLTGAVADKLGIDFTTEEVMLTVSGPARERDRPAPTRPGGFTTVGSPLTGIVGGFLFNGTAYYMNTLKFSMDNKMKVMNDFFAYDRAQGYYRDGRRSCTFTMDAYVDDDESVLAAGETYSDNKLLIYAGNASGRIIALYMPRCEFDNPATADADGAMKWSFKGVGKETLAGLSGAGVGGNDEAYLGFC